jgi:hypothetical protein
MTTRTMKDHARIGAARGIATLASRRPDLTRAPARRIVTVRCRLASGFSVSRAIRTDH